MEPSFDNGGGLVPAIIQAFRSGDVLMLGFMNAEALAETQRTREAAFFSCFWALDYTTVAAPST